MEAMFTMVHLGTETEDGLIHIQNYVGFYRGQHHVHTKEGYEKWLRKNKMNRKEVKIQAGTCACGLQAGDVKEYDGRKWHSEDF